MQIESSGQFRWTAAERRAWKPRPRLLPSEWAERYRRLPRSQSARPGRWDNRNAPYLTGLMDIPLKPGVTEVYVMKAAQVGGSECLRNVMGYLSDYDPGPIGLALPDRDKGRKIVDNRIIPLYEKTKALREKMTGKAQDIQKGQLKLADHTIHLMWAGSPAAMSSDPMRFAFCDEVDKFPAWAGKEADPISLIRKRLRTYEDRARLWALSTATTIYGRIATLFDSATHKLYYCVPCPHCGKYQRLWWSQIKWEKPDGLKGRALAEYLQATGHVWYECDGCGGKMREADKAAAIRAGRWQTEDGAIEDAEKVDRFPPGTRLGFQISAWYALWVSFADVAAEFLSAKGQLNETFAFVTQTRGEPFEQRLKKTSSTAYAEKSTSAPLGEGIIPKWAVRLIATIDTQHDHFWLVIRAWGPGLRSQRVFHSRVETFDELARWCWGTPWAVEDEAFAPKTCDMVLIDSGGTKLAGEETSRTMQVYEWCQRTGRAVPIKGSASPKSGMYWWDGEGFLKRVGSQKGQKLRIWYAAVHHWNDELQTLIDDDGDSDNPPRWNLNARNDPEYNTHMANAQKVARRKGAALVEEWVPVSPGARIDYRDCEVYQVAGAYWLNVHLLPGTEEIERMRAAQRAATTAKKKPQQRIGRGFHVESLGGYL